ncbi:YbhB/YbcL family Raf kinase inhibitor-like protein [Lyngbya confervoides]|uniref:YbhB/YbcL family Raf kinase inhibitor-like protein n=1 Tax=Lyngbya confervoides BDU141951 TaxID=1574623 RepID=A0ABD4T1B5_9CYAN|nr:YbhB/YbcL family Raf kinase inhibitor-like protein [Lyngbya confervoides]MCM1982372.1 YbhB/YbcL family Raf kinase inhibitor-like protein [Lyngbya confervoides BDU141951]
MALTLTSPAFSDQGAIPKRHTCQGPDLSPPLAWTGVSEATKSLVLIVDDPDAPDPAAPKMTWVHWLLFNIPPQTQGLPEGVQRLPAGTQVGLNDFKTLRYGGPCPPIGRHRYFHTLYALDTCLALTHPSRDQLEAAMQGHILEQAELMGTYQKF